MGQHDSAGDLLHLERAPTPDHQENPSVAAKKGWKNFRPRSPVAILHESEDVDWLCGPKRALLVSDKPGGGGVRDSWS